MVAWDAEELAAAGVAAEVWRALRQAATEVSDSWNHEREGGASAEDTRAAGDNSVHRNLRRPVFNLYAPTSADYVLGSYPADYSHLVLQRTASRGQQINLVGNAALFTIRVK